MTKAYEEECLVSKNNRLCKKLRVRNYVKKYYASKVIDSAYCQDVWSNTHRPAIVCFEQFGEREEEDYLRFKGMKLFDNGIYTAYLDKLDVKNSTECLRDSTNEVERYFYNLSETEYDFWRLCPYGWKRSCTKEGITCISRDGGFENQRFFTQNQIPMLRNDSTWLPIALQVSTGLYYTSKETVPVTQGEVICIMSWTELNAKINTYRCHAISSYGCEKVQNSFCFTISGSPGNRFRIQYNFELVRDKALDADLIGGVYCLNYMPFAYTYCTRSTVNEAFMIDESWGGRHKTTAFVFHFFIQRLRIDVPMAKETWIRVIGLTIFAIHFILLYNIVKKGISF